MPATDPATAYARSVASGEVPASLPTRLACERHLRDLDRSRERGSLYYFNADEAAFALQFFTLLRHYKGEWAGDRFAPQPWQEFAVASIYGWKRRDNGLRRFRYSYMEVPRKNGKTFLAAGHGLFGLIGDGEAGPEVYSAATKEDQAKLAWRDSEKMARRESSFEKRLKFNQKQINSPFNDGFFRPLGADSETLDGLNPSVAIADELHAWRDRNLWDVLDDAMGARAQPVFHMITTAGFSRASFCYQYRQHALSVLEGGDGYTDDQLFALIYTVDDGDDPFDPLTWTKANPNLGVSKSREWMAAQAKQAQQMPGKLPTFLTKQLNIWTEGETRWLNMGEWDRAAEPVDLDAMEGRPCYGGLDLAKIKDISSFALWWPPVEDDPFHRLRVWHWVPADNIRERAHRDRVPYPQWRDEGRITATAGNTTDFDFLGADILKLAGRFNIRDIGFDRTFANELLQYLIREGLDMVAFGQGYFSMGPPCAEFERLLTSGRLRPDVCPVLRWMAANAVVRFDPAGNIKTDKDKSGEKIDGVVASIMALGRSMVDEHVESVYETRGVRML